MRTWLTKLAVFLVFLIWGPSAKAQKFYPDDPLKKEPPPWPVIEPGYRALSPVLEFFSNTLTEPGQRQPEIGVIPAGGVNTLGEVMDGAWFVNRHGRHRMTNEALMRGPGDQLPPSMDGKWQALTVKGFGIRPGILIADSERQLYLLRFDPLGYLEMATGAEMVSSKFFYALGYNVPENYIVYFQRDQIEASEDGEDITSLGKTRDLEEEDIDRFLKEEAKDPVRGYRAVATRLPGHWEGLMGPFQVYGLRSDDPNDLTPHEHRHDLRGLFVFAAWLDHVYMTTNSTLDVMVEENNVPFIRHYLIDFVATLGSGAGGRRPKIVWEGNELAYDRGSTLKNIAGLGVWSPNWMRAKYPKYPSIGRFEYKTFEPDKWVTDAEIAPFANRLPDDTYWAARRVMAFSNDDIRALVSTGEYSDSEAEAWLAECLIERRNKIGKTYFSEVLPLDGFEVVDGELKFEDLADHYDFIEPRSYRVQWSTFENKTEKHTNLGASASTFEIPPSTATAVDGSHFAARIWADDPLMAVTVYFRKKGDGLQLVGLERH